MRKKVRITTILSCIIPTALLLSPSAILHAQDIDPFYPKLLEKGVQSYLAGDYKEALKQLKIAVFGLHSTESLQAKAYLYMSLCHHSLKNTEESENYARKMVGLMEEEQISMELSEKVRLEFSGLLHRFHLGELHLQKPEAKVITNPQENPSSPPPSRSPPRGSAEDLEERIRANPSNLVNYYKLYELYKAQNTLQKAQKTLDKLVKNHPDEVYGFYLLGLMHYQDDRYRDAERNFAEALTPKANIMFSETLIEEVRAYQILSVYHRGDQDRARAMMKESRHVFTKAKIRNLPLDDASKRLLLSLR